MRCFGSHAQSSVASRFSSPARQSCSTGATQDLLFGLVSTIALGSPATRSGFVVWCATHFSSPFAFSPVRLWLSLARSEVSARGIHCHRGSFSFQLQNHASQSAPRDQLEVPARSILPAQVLNFGFDFLYCVWSLAGGSRCHFWATGLKAQLFLVRITFSQWFSEHDCKVFGEMCERILSAFWFVFGAVVSHLTLLASIIVFRYVSSFPNPVLKTDSSSIAMRS
jgi:hypothetical protein